MENLNRMSSYFNEKERRRLEQKAKTSQSGCPDMTVEEIRLSCLENNGYETPELNEKLYLHFRGYRRIENLDAYTGCKAIWLESNGFDKIENLDKLVELRCLYLSKNLIPCIEGLDCLRNLTILDLSNNRLNMIQNLACCPLLQTINISHNFLSTPDSIDHFKECLQLTNIDITNNRLQCEEEFITTFQSIPALVALSVNGNDVTKLPSFRKRLIGTMPKLGYLDRPVEEQERHCAIAFLAGGVEAEAVARQEWRDEQVRKREQERADFRAWQESQRQFREKARAEGRSLITEFTPEEQEKRKKEAEDAHDAEQRLLSLGIERLGAKYFSVAGSTGKEDALDVAARELLREQSKLQEQQEQEQQEEGEGNGPKILSNVEIASIGQESEGAAAATTCDEDHPESKVDSTEHEPQTADEILETPPAVVDIEALERARQEREESYVREQRVQESLEIYKRQMKDRKANGGLDPVKSTHSTWDSASVPGPVTISGPRPLYWSEDMDFELARQVKDKKFDFDAISEAMISAAQAKRLRNDVVHSSPGVLTNEACRLRWSQLDASQWSIPAPGVTAQDTIFRMNVSRDVLESGVQPTYDALKSLATSARPGYLKTPKDFPTVAEALHDSDIDDELNLD